MSEAAGFMMVNVTREVAKRGMRPRLVPLNLFCGGGYGLGYGPGGASYDDAESAYQERLRQASAERVRVAGLEAENKQLRASLAEALRVVAPTGALCLCPEAGALALAECGGLSLDTEGGDEQ